MYTLHNTQFTGKVFYVLSSLESTNSFALKLLSKGKPEEGTAILALHQQSGKGHFGKKWQGEKGLNIYLSIIYYPDFLKVSSNFDLSRCIALSVREFVTQLTDKKVCIKWPNDIYLDDKKVCGILIENGVMRENLTHSIIGIGINVNQTEFDSNIPNPVSMKQITGKHYDIMQLTKTLFSFIEKNYLRLKSGDANYIKENYERNLYQLNEKIRLKDSSENMMTVTLKGTTEEGYLKVLTADGNELKISHGVYTWVVK